MDENHDAYLLASSKGELKIMKNLEEKGFKEKWIIQIEFSY